MIAQQIQITSELGDAAGELLQISEPDKQKCFCRTLIRVQGLGTLA